MLDRDGTIIAERHYLSHPDQVELMPGSASGLRTMRDLGCGLLVLTNQSGIGRGYFDVDMLAKVHGRMTELLAAEGVELDGIYYCPHTPEQCCDCRKPATGLALRAAAEHGFEPATGFVVGDKRCDVDLGRNIGARSILVRTGYGNEEARLPDLRVDHICDDLADAASFIAECVP
jgi:D-glycero-D-manno-heptose 1,7-bisphosphate phosphatase